MADLLVGFDLDKPAGSRFAPEVVAEINEVAPGAPPDGSIITPKLAPNAVTAEKVAPGAITGPKLATGAVGTAALGNGAVTGGKLAPGSVTGDKAGAGVVTAIDIHGNAVPFNVAVVSAAEYASLQTPDPNTAYYIHD